MRPLRAQLMVVVLASTFSANTKDVLPRRLQKQEKVSHGLDNREGHFAAFYLNYLPQRRTKSGHNIQNFL